VSSASSPGENKADSYRGLHEHDDREIGIEIENVLIEVSFISCILYCPQGFGMDAPRLNSASYETFS
jgi:hypothetical protein